MNQTINRMFYVWWGALSLASIYNFFDRHNTVWGIICGVLAIASIIIANATDSENKEETD